MSRRHKIQFIGLIILVGFFSAVCWHYILGVYCRWPYPFDTFLFLPEDKFNDFFNPCNFCRHNNPYFEDYFITSNYFPLTNVIFYLFSRLPRNFGFILFTTAFVLPFIALIASQLHGGNKCEYTRNVITFSLLTYPFLIGVDRGNSEGLLFVSLCAFLLMDDSRPILKSFLLAVPIAMKLYPAAFLVLLAGEKKYKQVTLVLVWAALLTIASLLTFKGGFFVNFMHVATGFNVNQLPAFSWNDQVYGGVGLFFPMKICLLTINRYLFPVTAWQEIKVAYRLCAVGLLGLVSIYVLFIERERWKKVALLTFVMLLIPEISADYKLLHIFLPLFVFLKVPTPKKSDWFYACMLGLLLIPKSYYFITHLVTDAGPGTYSIGAIINPLIMTVMSAVIISSGLRSRRVQKNRNSDTRNEQFSCCGSSK
jgi:cbb3-type cytochrome oxidase subunit 3